MKKKFALITLTVLSIWFMLFIVRATFSQVDYYLVNNGSKPFFSYERGFILDGGTKIYQGFGYTLTSLCRFSSENEIKGYDKGPIIEFQLNSFFFPFENRKNIRFVKY